MKPNNTFKSNIDILIHVEDPGSINFLKDLPPFFDKESLSYLFICHGFASTFFDGNNCVIDTNNKDADSIINFYNPSIVIIGTSENKNSFSFDLILACRKKNIFSIGIVDMWCNAANRFKGNENDPLFFIPNELFVPDEKTKNKYVKLGVTEDEILVTGNPIFESALEFREKNITAINNNVLDEGNLKIVFISEGWDRLDESASMKNPRYNFNGRGNSSFRTHIVMEELIDSIKKTALEATLTLRVHPNSSIKDFEPIASEFDMISLSGNPYNICLNNDLVVGMSSMLLLESALIGKPTLSILPEPQELEWMPNNLDGPTIVTQSVNDLENYWHNKKYLNYNYIRPDWATPEAKNIIIKRLKDIIINI